MRTQSLEAHSAEYVHLVIIDEYLVDVNQVTREHSSYGTPGYLILCYGIRKARDHTMYSQFSRVVHLRHCQTEPRPKSGHTNDRRRSQEWIKDLDFLD